MRDVVGRSHEWMRRGDFRPQCRSAKECPQRNIKEGLGRKSLRLLQTLRRFQLKLTKSSEQKSRVRSLSSGRNGAAPAYCCARGGGSAREKHDLL